MAQEKIDWQNLRPTSKQDLAVQVQVLPRTRTSSLTPQRLEQRTNYDMEMMRRDRLLLRALKTTPAISTGGKPGDAPFTLLDYFPKDFLLIVDESRT